MYTRASRWLRRSLVVCALALPSAIHAQPPPVTVRTGTLTITSGASRPSITLGDSPLESSAVFDDGAFEAERCRPCVAGSSIGVGGRVAAAGKGAQVYEADFTFSGPPVEIPQSGDANLVLTSTFMFQGRLIASPRRNSPADERDSAITLEGAGTVTVKLASSIDPDSGARLYFFQDATYQFSPTAK